MKLNESKRMRYSWIGCSIGKIISRKIIILAELRFRSRTPTSSTASTYFTSAAISKCLQYCSQGCLLNGVQEEEDQGRRDWIKIEHIHFHFTYGEEGLYGKEVVLQYIGNWKSWLLIIYSSFSPLPSPLLHSTPVRTYCWVKCCNKSSSSMLTNSFGKCPLEWAVVLAQLVERLLPTLAVCGLNPVIGEFLNRTFVYIAVLKRQN